MMPIDGQLYTRDGTPAAAIAVSRTPDGYTGTADVTAMPPILRRLFDRYDEVVAGQILTLLDEAEADIAAIGCFVVLIGQPGFEVSEIQLLPSSGQIFFRQSVTTRVSAPS